jgi:hypothetical protein
MVFSAYVNEFVMNIVVSLLSFVYVGIFLFLDFYLLEAVDSNSPIIFSVIAIKIFGFAFRFLFLCICCFQIGLSKIIWYYSHKKSHLGTSQTLSSTRGKGNKGQQDTASVTIREDLQSRGIDFDSLASPEKFLNVEDLLDQYRRRIMAKESQISRMTDQELPKLQRDALVLFSLCKIILSLCDPSQPGFVVMLSRMEHLHRGELAVSLQQISTHHVGRDPPLFRKSSLFRQQQHHEIISEDSTHEEKSSIQNQISKEDSKLDDTLKRQNSGLIPSSLNSSIDHLVHVIRDKSKGVSRSIDHGQAPQRKLRNKHSEGNLKAEAKINPVEIALEGTSENVLESPSGFGSVDHPLKQKYLVNFPSNGSDHPLIPSKEVKNQ